MNNILLALHLIGMVCWFAGLFYLPRLFVYHAMTQSQAVREQLKIMEHKLYFYITYPSMGLTLVTGLWLMNNYIFEKHGFALWLTFKLIFVALLVAFHFRCGYHLEQFKYDRNQCSHRFFRCFNEVPSVLLLVIVFLAVLKP